MPLLLPRELPYALRLRSWDVPERGWMMAVLEDLLPKLSELAATTPRQRQSEYALSLLQPAWPVPANECLLSRRAR